MGDGDVSKDMGCLSESSDVVTELTDSWMEKSFKNLPKNRRSSSLGDDGIEIDTGENPSNVSCEANGKVSEGGKLGRRIAMIIPAPKTDDDVDIVKFMEDDSTKVRKKAEVINEGVFMIDTCGTTPTESGSGSVSSQAQEATPTKKLKRRNAAIYSNCQ